jgi:triacylglycerol lipase
MKVEEYILSATRASLAYKSKEELSELYENSSLEVFKNVQTLPIFYSSDGAQAYSYIQNEVFYLSFRGTDERSDVLADLDILRTYLFEDRPSILVHRGFLNYFNEIKEDIISQINASSHLFHTIQVTGHSLGGAMATIAAAFIGELVNNPTIKEVVNFKPKDKAKKRIVCHTVGSPRVGNIGFVNWFHSHVDESMRIANDDDPITLFPISCLYTHVSEAICINDKCRVKELHSDVKWYWRILSFPFYKASASDHSCNTYIHRLLQLIKVPGPV